MEMEENVASKPGFEQLRQEGDNESDRDMLSTEEDGFLGQKARLRKRQRMWKISARACTIFNICFTIILLSILALTSRSRCYGAPEPPYSPLWEDGAVKYVNKRIRPMKIFQSETSDEVERAWNATLGPSEGVITLPKEYTSKLPQTLEAWFKPGHYVYGVSVFHQLHCLNRIRKTFYADKFFAHESEKDIQFHKNHCFDLLRQTIACNGDASLVSWWNRDFTYKDNDGKKQLTQKYLSMSPKERAKEAVVFWDVKTRCHDLDAITAWTEKHRAK
ncbi:uncharacterized protein CIMG_02077 [Coccidioides immitis RS]|uniref:Tat pathway signal sequence n=2 Tax=Coccidioides immitis TaxID=5501 RepID=J3KKL3_COCIM|nr:uncharacterized protein CIMG_02077 [Coccidioides immitis RS]EAS36723.3 hypothetical protein CIMG_02077 [Coccidioides immitis RS]